MAYQIIGEQGRSRLEAPRIRHAKMRGGGGDGDGGGRLRQSAATAANRISEGNAQLHSEAGDTLGNDDGVGGGEGIATGGLVVE
jgi:hypothetical protein